MKSEKLVSVLLSLFNSLCPTLYNDPIPRKGLKSEAAELRMETRFGVKFKDFGRQKRIVSG